jgi:polysaccharide pyruvyl transferase WcaK-like protein
VSTPKHLTRWLLKNMTVYWDVGEWLEAMGRVDFVAGTRFHGCMMGVQAGVPCFLITHDTRTEEMAEHFALPHKRIEDEMTIDLEELREAADMEPARARYVELRAQFASFLRRNGLEPSEPSGT